MDCIVGLNVLGLLKSVFARKTIITLQSLNMRWSDG